MDCTSKGDLRLICDDVVSATSNAEKVTDKISRDVSDKELDSNSTGTSASGISASSV